MPLVLLAYSQIFSFILQHWFSLVVCGTSTRMLLSGGSMHYCLCPVIVSETFPLVEFNREFYQTLGVANFVGLTYFSI